MGAQWLKARRSLMILQTTWIYMCATPPYPLVTQLYIHSCTVSHTMNLKQACIKCAKLKPHPFPWLTSLPSHTSLFLNYQPLVLPSLQVQPASATAHVSVLPSARINTTLTLSLSSSPPSRGTYQVRYTTKLNLHLQSNRCKCTLNMQIPALCMLYSSRGLVYIKCASQKLCLLAHSWGHVQLKNLHYLSITTSALPPESKYRHTHVHMSAVRNDLASRLTSLKHIPSHMIAQPD